MASIFKNPFDVEKDQLIRQVFELPVRIAAIVESRRKHLRTDEAEILHEICAPKLAAQEEEELIHSIANEKKNEDVESVHQRGAILGTSFHLGRMEAVEETWQGANMEPLNLGKRKRGVVEGLRPDLTNISKIMAGCMDTSSICKILDPDVKTALVTTLSDDAAMLAPQRKSTVEQFTEVHKEMDKNSSQDARKTAPSAGWDQIVLPPPSAGKKTTYDIAVFLLTIIRTLRHTRLGNTQKLLEVLSIGDFLVDKCQFLEELIDLAYRYNKDAVAKELSRHLNQLSDGLHDTCE